MYANHYIEILELKKRVVWSYDEGDKFLVKKHIYGNSFTTQMMSLKQVKQSHSISNNHIDKNNDILMSTTFL